MRGLIAAMIVGFCPLAYGAPPDGPLDPRLHEWFSGLRQPETGIGCCSIADCRGYEARMAKDHYEIKVNDHWYSVPNEVVLHRENLTGMPVACLTTRYSPDFATPKEYDPGIRCFIPGPET